MSEEKNGESKPQKEQAEKLNLNEEQYKLLLSCSDKKDMTEWNQWREKHKKEDVLLEGANIARARIVSPEQEIFSSAWLEGANLSNAYLKEADLRGAHLKGANLEYAHMERAKLGEAHLEGTCLTEAHLNGANLLAAHLEGANLMLADLQGAILNSAHLEGAEFNFTDLRDTYLRYTHLQGTRFGQAIVDGFTSLWGCEVDDYTDFRGVGLESLRIEPSTKQLLEYNIRRKNWEEWYSKHPLLRWPAWLFWLMSDYGLSTGRIIGSCLLFVFIFATIYFVWGYVDYYHGINEPGIVKELFIAPKPEQMSGFYYGLMIGFRSICLSVATMFTFGDISVVNAQFGWKWWFSHFIPISQMIMGYMLLGALITRLSILFTAGGPAGKFTKK